MDVVLTHCAGLDVHKKTVVVCCLTPGPTETPQREIRTFGTMTSQLLTMADWLAAQGVTHVAMESTGEFWKPIYNLLEGSVEVLVVNAARLKHVPGRKTDVKDAEWIAQLLRHGLLRASFIPPQPQRDLRDLTRQRTILVQERAAVVNRLQKVLEWANLKLASVVTDVVGVSARAILQALVDGQSDVSELAELARGRLKGKRAELEQALQGRVRDHHRFLIASHLTHIEFLDEQIEAFDQQIATALHPIPPSPPATPPGAEQPPSGAHLPTEPAVADTPVAWEEAATLLDTIPGIGRRVAEIMIAEMGTDMRRFPSADHLASWVKLCPGTHESAGKRTSSRIGKGNLWLRRALVQAAHAAVRVRDSYLNAFFRRVVARHGLKKAIVAVAHKLIVIAYALLTKREPYRDLGSTYFDERHKQRRLNHLRHELEKLGYAVTLDPISAAA